VPVVTYSLIRLALFGAALGVLLWVGARGWLVPLVAAVIAFALSYVLFARQRDAAGAWMAERAASRQRRSRLAQAVEQDEAEEDAIAERLRRGAGTARPARPADDPAAPTRTDDGASPRT
jgi:hypothetical protein